MNLIITIMNGLTILEMCVVFYWYLLDNWSYVQFLYYTNEMGLLPRYAFKKVFKRL